MTSLASFASLTLLTQLVLLANQLVLLPFQLRVWGEDVTALWFTVLSVANLLAMGDLGLRNVGHAQLLAAIAPKGDPRAAAEFRATWALTRLCFALLFGLVILAYWGAGLVIGHDVPGWAILLMVATAAETLLIVRGVWLDSLGLYRRVEAVYFSMAATRLVASLAALALGAPPLVLAVIAAAASVGAALAQEVVVPGHPLLSLRAGGFGRITWGTLAVVRYSLTEPAQNWVRINLPVLALATMAQPLAVTTFVALRAAFGLARQMAYQTSRYASVEYVRRLAADPSGARRLVLRAVAVNALASALLSGALLIDGGRLVGLWLGALPWDLYPLMLLTFAAATVAFSHQVLASIVMRQGRLGQLAGRYALYMAASAVAAGIGAALQDPGLYLGLVALCELLVAGLFLAASDRAVALRGAGVLAASLLAVLAVAAVTDAAALGWPRP